MNLIHWSNDHVSHVLNIVWAGMTLSLTSHGLLKHISWSPFYICFLYTHVIKLLETSTGIYWGYAVSWSDALYLHLRAFQESGLLNEKKMDIFPPQFPHSSTHLKSSYMYHINVPCTWDAPCTLRWRHNERDGIWNHQPHDCLLSRLFRRRSKKTSKLRVTGLCAGNWPVNSPHKGPVTRKLFPFDDVIMISVFTVVRGTPVYQVWLNILGVCA